MKKLVSSLVILLMFSACNENDHAYEPNWESSHLVYSAERKIPTSNLTSAFVNTDWSGQITTETFYQDFGPSQSPNGYVQLPSDFVIVGGGAETYETDAGGGAYLTESRPDFQNNRWYARSKDHKVGDPHKLRIYAVGLKINGMSAATLRGYMTAPEITSPTANHPSMTLPVIGYKVIGGGARVNWSVHGNMLTDSRYLFNGANGWYAASKDHIYADPCTITVWAIGIKENIPGFGNVDVVPTSGYSGLVSVGVASAQSTAQINVAGTCPGAGTYNYYPNAAGRMLTKVFSLSQNNARAENKDNTIISQGAVTAYMLSLKKRP